MIDVTTVWIMLAVIFLIFAIAIIYRKWAASIERYVVAERAQSPWINGLALFSTYLSAWAVLGGPGICYAYGIVEFATFVGWGIGVFIILWYYLPKIRDLGAKYGATGLASFMEAYFNSRHVGIVAGIVSWYALLYYLVGQIKGLGLAFSYGTGLKYEVAAIVAIAVVLVYLILSGLKAVIIVDAFCTIVMIAFFTASLYLVFALGGGNIFNTIEKISSYDPRLLYPTGAPYTSDPISLWVFSVLVYAMWQFTPYAWQNYLALRSSKKKDLAIFVSLATVSGGLITWVLILGPVGRVFLPYKVSPDTVVLEVGKYFLPSLYPLFLVGIFLTILATVDSTLLAGSADLYVALRGIIKPIEKKAGAINIYRLIMVGTAVLASYFAVVYTPEFMVYTMLIGMTGVSAALAGPLAVGLLWKKDPIAADVSLIVSLLLAQLLVLYGITPWLTGCFIGLVASVLLYITIVLARSHR